MEHGSNSTVEHKTSMLLTKDENEQIFQLLGPRCQSIATTVVQMFSTDGPDGVHWIKRDVGILCMVRDINKRSYFFRLFCLIQNRMIWEHEIYNSMQYLAPRSFLHTFEAEDRIVAFNFANESEAAFLREKLLSKLEKKKQQRISRQNKRNVVMNSQNSVNRPAPPPNATKLSNGYSPSTTLSSKSFSGKKFKKKSITKADIGQPLNFKHVSHVGFDPNTGFEIGNVDESIRQFFDKAGISENQLRDKATRNFIYEFIEKNGGMDAVKSDIHHVVASTTPPPSPPPRVPTRSVPPAPQIIQQTLQTSLRSAPPPPPPPSGTRTQHPAPPPPPSVPPPANVLVQRNLDHQKRPAPVPTVSALSTADRPHPPSPPVPPPPMPPDPIVVPSPPTNGNSSGISNDPRSALMEAIRSGKTLKHVETGTNKSSQDDPRGDLLNEIRNGVELKPVQPNTKSANNSVPAGGLAGALARALAERARVIQTDSSDTSDTSDTDDDWDD